MSLMKFRQWMQNRQVLGIPASEFRALPSVGRIVMHSLIAILFGGFSLKSLLEGNESATVGVLLASVFGLLALVNWHRLQDEREEQLLPKRILCPSCEASIVLSAEERQTGRFACSSCGEDFEVDGG